MPELHTRIPTPAEIEEMTATISSLDTIFDAGYKVQIESLNTDGVRLCAVDWSGIVDYEGIGTIAEAADAVAAMVDAEMSHE